MPRLVDGDNLLGSWPGRKRSQAERRALAGELARFAARERRRLVLVFDGPDQGMPAKGDVLYSGPGRSADQAILALLREQKDRAGWTVITNDRSLADQCRWLGASVERCDIFRKKVQQPGAAEKPAAELDVDDWMKIFGED